jgi:hypothetical protein
LGRFRRSPEASDAIFDDHSDTKTGERKGKMKRRDYPYKD